MYKEEVWIGSNSLGPFVWVSNEFWCVSRRTRLNATAGFIVLTFLGQDGLGTSSLFASPSACINKWSQLVPTALVLSLGLAMSFGVFRGARG